VAEEYDNELDLDVLRGLPREKVPNCPVCDEPMTFNDGAFFCPDCNGADCGPETG
jgi:Zn finger protein HypA/HybF involved in hydrogenase expression